MASQRRLDQLTNLGVKNRRVKLPNVVVTSIIIKASTVISSVSLHIIDKTGKRHWDLSRSGWVDTEFSIVFNVGAHAETK